MEQKVVAAVLEHWVTTLGLLGAWIGVAVLIWQTIITRQSWQQQLRAYVLPQQAGIFDGTTVTPPQPARTNFPGVVMVINNHGATPAYKVRSFAQIAVIFTRDENTNLAVPRIAEQFALTLGANGSFSKSIWFDRPLAANEIADIASGARAIYLYGRVEYRDAFGKSRFANFRLRYQGLYPPPANAIFNFSEQGNDAN